VEALEGGPLVLKATLTYQGEKETTLYSAGTRQHFSVEASQPWQIRLVVRALNGPVGYTQTYRPGDHVSEVAYLHHGYSGIARGDVKLKVKWPLYKDQDGPLVVAPCTTLDVTIPPADADHLAALRKRLEGQLRREDLTEDEQRGLARVLLYTEHRALVPVALEMLSTRPSAFTDFAMVEFAYGCGGDPAELHEQLAKLATAPGSRPQLSVFEYWRMNHVSLPEASLKRLCGARSLWTRALTFTTFGKQCDKAWIEATIRELSDLQKPVPADQFGKLLADLDDATFSVRQDAQTQLEEFGERVVPQLRESLRGSLSPEVKRRVKLLLDKLGDGAPPRPCVDTLGYLENLKTPEARSVLDALARGDADAWVTKEAKRILDSRPKAP
jgi:hypothetical protein